MVFSAVVVPVVFLVCIFDPWSGSAVLAVQQNDLTHLRMSDTNRHGRELQSKPISIVSPTNKATVEKKTIDVVVDCGSSRFRRIEVLMDGNVVVVKRSRFLRRLSGKVTFGVDLTRATEGTHTLKARGEVGLFGRTQVSGEVQIIANSAKEPTKPPTKAPAKADQPGPTKAPAATPVATPPVATTPVAATPVATTPVATTPVAASPVASTPVATSPVAMTPVATTPVVTTPVATTPVATTPVAATPVASTPVATSPVATTPVAANPVATTPVATTPVASTPVASTPVASSPVATTPVATTPVATTPVATTPVATTPVATTPVAGTPVAATPVASTPVATSPVATTPVATTPVATTPVAATPVVTTPFASTPGSAPATVPMKPPTNPPTKPPTKPPSIPPTKQPTRPPTKPPTKAPTTKPPTKAPTKAPVKLPTKSPTKAPTRAPTCPAPANRFQVSPQTVFVNESSVVTLTVDLTCLDIAGLEMYVVHPVDPDTGEDIPIVIGYLTDDGVGLGNETVPGDLKYSGIVTEYYNITGDCHGYHAVPVINGEPVYETELFFEKLDATCAIRRSTDPPTSYSLRTEGIEYLVLVIDYSWPYQGGNLDTGAAFLGNMVGVGCGDILAPYLAFSGDDAGYGIERVLIYLGESNTDQLWTTTTTVTMNAAWSEGPHRGPASVSIRTYHEYINNFTAVIDDNAVSFSYDPDVAVGAGCANKTIALAQITVSGQAVTINVTKLA